MLLDHRFIEYYMPQASGEYVKVYIEVLRYAGDGEITISEIADRLDLTEKDVLRAIRYWEEAGLFSSGWNPDGTLASLEVRDFPAQESALASAEPAPAPARRRRRPATVQDVQGDVQFSDLMTAAQEYTGIGELPRRDMEIMLHLYKDLGMSARLLEHLVETCVESGHRDFRYMEKVALSWHEKGVTTVAQAREVRVVPKEYYQVMREMGITDRAPVRAEQEVLDRWFKTMEMPADLILEACRRTMAALHKPSFSYADKILEEWKKAGITQVEEIEEKDRKPEPAVKRPSGRGTAVPRTGAFKNFEERGGDLDAEVLERVRRRRARQEEQAPQEPET